MIPTDTPNRPCLVMQTQRRGPRTTPPPHVVDQNGGGMRVWTVATGSSVALNWRTGNYDFDGLGRELPKGGRSMPVGDGLEVNFAISRNDESAVPFTFAITFIR